MRMKKARDGQNIVKGVKDMSEQNKNRNRDKGKQNNKNKHDRNGDTVEFSEESVFNVDKKKRK